MKKLRCRITFKTSAHVSRLKLEKSGGGGGFTGLIL